ncbi:MAG: hypothetical protein WCW31_03405 [Patescibacteria group bacterium]
MSKVIKLKIRNVLSTLANKAKELKTSELQAKRTAYEAIQNFLTQELETFDRQGRLALFLGLMLLRDMLATVGFENLNPHFAKGIEEAIQILSNPKLQTIDLREVCRLLEEYGFVNRRGIEAYVLKRGPVPKTASSARTT